MPITASGELLDIATLSLTRPGALPEGWTVKGRNPAVLPRFQCVKDHTDRYVLEARGNGRDECFGWIEHPASLTGGKSYRLRVRFRIEGFEDVNHHLQHAFFSPQFNHGVFDYYREGDAVVGEGRFVIPLGDVTGAVRLYFRYCPHGAVFWRQVSLEECDPVAARPVKITVTHGAGDLARWGKVLDAAGAVGSDVVLLPEAFDGNHDPLKSPGMNDPAMKLLADKARQHHMHVSASLYLKRGDLFFNTAPLFDRQGQLIGTYDKNMLYDPEVDQGATCGTEMPVFQTDFGKVGIMICYDSWHPSVAKLLALKGAEVILFPSAGYYTQLMYARAADNGVVIAASSEGGPYGIWDAGGNQAGEEKPDASRHAPNSIVSVDVNDELKLMSATVDLSRKPSPHYWGGPMLSAPGGRRVRSTSPIYLEDEIAKEVRRWAEPVANR